MKKICQSNRQTVTMWPVTHKNGYGALS